MVILWTVILAVVFAWIWRRIGILRSEGLVGMRIECVKETTREDRDMCGIYLAQSFAMVQALVSTVWTSRLVIIYLRLSELRYRRQTWVLVAHLRCTRASLAWKGRRIMMVMEH